MRGSSRNLLRPGGLAVCITILACTLAGAGGLATETPVGAGLAEQTREHIPPAASHEMLPQGAGQGCTDGGCHSEMSSRAHVHAPVRLGRCDVCHTVIEGGTPFESGARHVFKRLSDDPDTCSRCHEDVAWRSHVHEPVKLGLCVLCHDPHGSDSRFFLRVGSDQVLCGQCHTETFEHGRHLHGPVATGACGSCHDPHQSDHPFRLRGSGPNQCATCHAADLRSFTASARVHAPVEQECNNCHDPHTGANQPRLFDMAPGLCLDCHQDVAHTKATGEVVHEPVGKGECLQCHDQHGSDHARLVKSPPPRLCLGCHEGMARHLADSRVVHKPVAEGRCLDCHEHHGGAHRKLLEGTFAEGPYTPFALDRYGLCYSCHEKQQVLEERTVTATGFRNGDLNLHWRHVNQDRKGRTCGLCHDVHASKNVKLIRESSPFGDWKMPIGFEPTATGGSCSPGCHVPRKYDRENPAVNK